MKKNECPWKIRTFNWNGFSTVCCTSRPRTPSKPTQTRGLHGLAPASSLSVVCTSREQAVDNLRSSPIPNYPIIPMLTISLDIESSGTNDDEYYQFNANTSQGAAKSSSGLEAGSLSSFRDSFYEQVSALLETVNGSSSISIGKYTKKIWRSETLAFSSAKIVVITRSLWPSPGTPRAHGWALPW